MTAILEITRKKSLLAALRKMSVLVDGKSAAELRNGQTAQLPVSPGSHTIEVLLGSVGSAPTRLEFAGGQTMQLGCQLKMGAFAAGNLVLTQRDGSLVEGETGPKRHHATLVFVLGLLGFLIGLLGLAALGQGIVDLRQMRAGKMDSSGRSLTVVGAVLGAIGFVLNVVGLFITLMS